MLCYPVLRHAGLQESMGQRDHRGHQVIICSSVKEVSLRQAQDHHGASCGGIWCCHQRWSVTHVSALGHLDVAAECRRQAAARLLLCPNQQQPNCVCGADILFVCSSSSRPRCRTDVWASDSHADTSVAVPVWLCCMQADQGRQASPQDQCMHCYACRPLKTNGNNWSPS